MVITILIVSIAGIVGYEVYKKLKTKVAAEDIAVETKIESTVTALVTEVKTEV